jgi:uncharacterized small protein (TIGR04563 family)
VASFEKRKQSLYFPESLLGEIMREAVRLDRSLSWVVQRAWRIASQEIAKFPAVDHAFVAAEAAPGAADVLSVPAGETRVGLASERPAGSQVREFLRGKFDREPMS